MYSYVPILIAKSPLISRHHVCVCLLPGMFFVCWCLKISGWASSLSPRFNTPRRTFSPSRRGFAALFQSFHESDDDRWCFQRNHVSLSILVWKIEYLPHWHLLSLRPFFMSTLETKWNRWLKKGDQCFHFLSISHLIWALGRQVSRIFELDDDRGSLLSKNSAKIVEKCWESVGYFCTTLFRQNNSIHRRKCLASFLRWHDFCEFKSKPNSEVMTIHFNLS